LPARFPVHVTVKLQRSLPRLRARAEHLALRAAFLAGCSGPRSGPVAAAPGAAAFRLCHYAILNDHLHLIVEAADRIALSRGLQGLLIRIAKALNRLWRRHGGVFSDRYHDRTLKSPREVRNAIRYVLANGKKHEAEGLEVRVPQPVDIYTSAPWFDGFRETFTVRGLEAVVRPVTDAKTWLLKTGWRRHGLISVHELPATG
jgi:putative transposase